MLLFFKNRHISFKKELLMKVLLLIIIAPFLARYADAEIITKEVTYIHDTVRFKGFLAYDNAVKGKRPGVLVAHEWWGLNDFAKTQAKNLARMGYAAFAVDLYGNGRSTDDIKIAGQLAGELRGTPRLRERMKAGFAAMNSLDLVDSKRVGAIGFCFGGTAVLELAYSGADCKGIVTFHGGLISPKEDDLKNIKAKLLVLHGAEDHTMTPEMISQFQESMRKSGADWQMMYFSNTVHSFTNPASGNDPSKGVAYNPLSAGRAFSYMKMFLEEVL
jgi:dienelactone hydrolase